MKRVSTSERGQVLPLVAICLAVLMGFAGMAVDVGYWEYQQRQQQNATDAAALGGAQQLIASGCPSSSNALIAARADASDNGFVDPGTGSGNVTVAVQNPPASGAYAGNGCAVYATITSKHVATFFSKVFGMGGGANGTQVSTSAVAAVVQANNNPCIMLMSSGTSSNFNGSQVNAPGCGIMMNDSANFNGATVRSLAIGYAGTPPNTNGASFPQASPAPALPVADPCPKIAGCESLAVNPPPMTNCQSVNDNGKTVTFTPGSSGVMCFSSLNLNGATATFNPGLYILESTNFNGASIAGSGVTFYVPAGATPPNFNGVSSANLTPPGSTSQYNGVLYYQVPSNTQSPNFNGSNISLAGLVYAPGATSVNFNGASGGYLVVVVGAANFNGSSAYDFATPAPGQGLIKNAVLGQ